MNPITKAAFAREIRVSKARISQYVRDGMPVLADGKIDADAARAWIERNTDPVRRMNYAADNHGRPAKVSASWAEGVQLIGDAYASACLALLYRVRAQVAGSVTAAGGSCAVAHMAANLAFYCLFSDTLALLQREGIDFDTRRETPINWPALAKATGETVDHAAWQKHQADRQRPTKKGKT